MQENVPSLNALEAEAEMWWPAEIKSEVADKSPEEVLRGTFEEFREQTVKSTDVDDLIENFRATDAGPINLFLKHMMLLLDVGGEHLKRVYRQRDDLFPNQRLSVTYDTQALVLDADFDAQLSNPNLCVDISGLAESVRRDGLYASNGDAGNLDDVERAIRLLCYGYYAKDDEVSSLLESYDFVDYVGDEDQFDALARARHIAVSNITKGGDAEASGRVLQKYVRDRLESSIEDPDDALEYRTDAKRDTPTGAVKSDIEVYNGSTGDFVSIEISFQVTTNSTIERKGNEATERYRKLVDSNNYAAYVVDGVGNFERSHAIERLRDNCHCIVACSDDELDRLAEFVGDELGTAK